MQYSKYTTKLTLVPRQGVFLTASPAVVLPGPTYPGFTTALFSLIRKPLSSMLIFAMKNVCVISVAEFIFYDFLV